MKKAFIIFGLVILTTPLRAGLFDSDDQFNLQAAGEGRVYRIDRKTGEVLLIMGDKSQVVAGTESIPRPFLERLSSFLSGSESNGSFRNFPDITHGKFKYTLMAWWHRGTAHYRFSIYPGKDIPAAVLQQKITEKPFSSFNLSFQNQTGFSIHETSILLNSLARVVDDKNELQYYEYQGDIASSFFDFMQIESWNTTLPLER